MQIKIVAVGSDNPVKIASVQSAFEKCFPEFRWKTIGVKVPSGVSNQPMSDKESIRGAKTRARLALKKVKGAEFGVGLEGGLQCIDRNWFDCGWAVVVDISKKEGIGSTARIHTPKPMMKLIRKGHELGDANDILTGRKNTKHQEGHMGIMTKGAITRKSAYTDGVIMALVPFLSPEFYSR